MLFLFPIMGFLILDLYVNLIPRLIPSGTGFWLLHVIFFFVLARHVARLTELEGLSDMGVVAHYGWKRNFKIGFVIGTAVWGAMYAVLGKLVGFRVAEVKELPEAAIFLIEACAVLLLGSLINDIIVRGYVFAHLRDKLPEAVLILLSSVIYAADDAWLTGFSMRNLLFSIVLGLSLGYALFRTGSIWMSTGLHWGMNLMYALVCGIPGREDAGGLLSIESYGASSSIARDNAPLIAAFALFIVVFMLYGRLRINAVRQ